MGQTIKWAYKDEWRIPAYSFYFRVKIQKILYTRVSNAADDVFVESTKDVAQYNKHGVVIIWQITKISLSHKIPTLSWSIGEESNLKASG